MQFPGYTGGNHDPPVLGSMPVDARVKFRHDELGGGGKIMFMSDGNLTALPQPADFIKTGFKNFKINIPDTDPVLHRFHNEFCGLFPVTS